MDDLVSTEWLAREIDQADIALLDASWFMPASGRDARAEYDAAHLPRARFFDLDAISDPAATAPHMLPGAAAFGAAMAALGVGRQERIVVYDNSPLRTAARAWFMLRHYGAERVAILDGGMAKWVAEGRALEHGAARVPPGARFDAIEARPDAIATLREIVKGDGALAILDARAAGRFDGREADPRANVAAGHIPGARNLPFAALYRDDGTLRDAGELKRLFDGAGIDPAAPFIASCGSGVTACSLILAARQLGGRDARLYDGSWSEWGADPATPKALGPA